MPFFSSLGILLGRVLVVVAVVLNAVTTFSGTGASGFVLGSSMFSDPSSTACDSSNNVYVTNNTNSIYKITPNGVVTFFVSLPDVQRIAMGPSDILYAIVGSGLVKITMQGVVTTFIPQDIATLGNRGLAVHSDGTVYTATTVQIWKITSFGSISLHAGDSAVGFIEGQGSTARFNQISGITLEPGGTLFVADTNNNRIRQVTPGGSVSTLRAPGGEFANTPAGILFSPITNLIYTCTYSNNNIVTVTLGGTAAFLSANGSGYSDGPVRFSQFGGQEFGWSRDSLGNIYIVDRSNFCVRKLASGVVSTIAGVGGLSGSAFGTEPPQYNTPYGVTTDTNGTVYIADQNNHCIRTITSTGVHSLLAGKGTSGSNNASGAFATFNSPRGIAVDSANSIYYVTDSGNRRIRKITSDRTVTTLSGTGVSGFADGAGTNATFNTPVGITITSTGLIYVTDIGNHNIRLISSTGTTSTHAGSRTATFADGIGTAASFNAPHGIVADSYGNLYIADTNNHRIRRITSDGIVTTLAGQATAGFADGTGSSAQFNFPYQISIDVLGNLYVADQTNNRIRKIQTSTGLVTTFAGNGTAGFVNATALNAQFRTPQGITVDKFRRAYVGDTGNHSIRKIEDVYTLPTNVVTTLAGSGTAGFTDLPGISASFRNPNGVAVDSQGNVYVADGDNHRIRRITSDGTVTTLAGNDLAGASDGTGANASFNTPQGVAVDSSGNVYVADFLTHRIRKITNGVVSTIAGNGSTLFTNGTGTNATFNCPVGIAVDSVGTLYVTELVGNRVRKIINGVVSTLAASLSQPHGIAVDLAGIVYVAEQGTHSIRKITPDGTVTTLAGSPGTAAFADGNGTNTRFSTPKGIAVDSSGILYVGDSFNHRIRRIATDGTVTTLAGSGSGQGTSTGAFADGVGTNTNFNSPQGIAVDSQGTVYVGDTTNQRIRKIGSGLVVQIPLNMGVVRTFAGGATANYLDATGTNALFNFPRGVAVDFQGNVFVADLLNQRIRRITRLGVVTTVAGNGTAAFADGNGTNARFSAPFGIAVNSIGHVFVAELGNHRIRRIINTTVTTLAGNGAAFADGVGTNARFNNPHAPAVDSQGNVYVADQGNFRIRKISSTGVVTTFAGSATSGSTDGTGAGATFSSPQGIAVDSAGFVYVADYGAHRIRKITPNGVVTTLAGTTQGFQDGTGTNARFNFPRGITVDLEGTVYVADESNHRIRKITPNGVVTTFAGSTQGFLDGTGTNTQFNFPVGLTVDSAGVVYVGDRTNYRIRKIQ